MEDVISEGTGTRVQFDGMHLAGKTGTTDNYRDLWFCGFSPYYTCSVWAGYDDNTVLPAGESRTYQQTLWRNIMERIHENLVDTEFKMPSTVEEASICTRTRLLATSSCNAVTEYFDIDQIPTQYCSGHYSSSYNYNYSDSYTQSGDNDGEDENERSGQDTGNTDNEESIDEPVPETPAEVPEETQPEESQPEETDPGTGGTPATEEGSGNQD